MSRAPLRCVLLLLATVAVGCASARQKPSVEPAPASASELPTASATPASAADARDPADLLAVQTTEYARSMESALAARSAPPSRSTSDPPSPTPFQVADEFRLKPESDGAARPTQRTPQHTPPKPPEAVGANRPIEVPGTTATPEADQPTPASDRPSAIRVEPVVVASSPLEQQLRQRVRDYPQDVSAHLDYQILLFLRDEPVPNLSAMSSLAAEDRELITAFMDGVNNFRNAVRADANMLMSRKVRPLVEMADRLRSRSDLGIPTVALCRKVEGFGRYEPIEPARFVAGKAHPVIIYCEVENFSSQLNDGKMWETKLSQDAVLYTETGLPVWSVKTESFSDLARNRRRDFFVVKLVTLPDNLVIGRYLLKVTIIDQQANRVAEASLPLQVVAR